MFWENLCILCNKHHTTPNAVCLAIGKSSATATKWKSGSIPRDTTLRLIADYFGITPEELLRGPMEKPSAPAEPPQPTDPLTDEFLELIDQLTLKELRELKAQMLDIIKNRK